MGAFFLLLVSLIGVSCLRESWVESEWCRRLWEVNLDEQHERLDIFTLQEWRDLHIDLSKISNLRMEACQILHPKTRQPCRIFELSVRYEGARRRSVRYDDDDVNDMSWESWNERP